MSRKAKQCVDCAHFHFPSDIRERAGCAMGHKPRFHKPRSPRDDDWGWKRRCDDKVYAEIEIAGLD